MVRNMKKVYPTQHRDPLLDTTGEVIAFYEREFYVFSNFSSFAVDWRGQRWQTSEHAYQAAHFFETAPELAEEIAQARSAHDAYRLAKQHAHLAPANWDEIKTSVMYEICREKLLQHPYIQEKLLDSGTLLIVEDSPKDAFWGWGPNRNGRNELGNIWVRLRSELKTRAN